MRRHVLQRHNERRQILQPRVRRDARAVPRKLARALVARPRLRGDLERIERRHVHVLEREQPGGPPEVDAELPEAGDRARVRQRRRGEHEHGGRGEGVREGAERDEALLEPRARVQEVVPGVERDVVHTYVRELRPGYHKVVRVERGLEVGVAAAAAAPGVGRGEPQAELAQVGGAGKGGDVVEADGGGVCPREVERFELARGGVGEGDKGVEGVNGSVRGHDV